MKDDPSDQADAAGTRLLLGQSERAMQEMLAAFDDMTAGLCSGGHLQVAEMRRLRLALAMAQVQLSEGMKRHEHRSIDDSGDRGEAALDLELLRRDIGRRLDRIRATADAEDVSGGASQG